MGDLAQQAKANILKHVSATLKESVPPWAGDPSSHLGTDTAPMPERLLLTRTRIACRLITLEERTAHPKPGGRPLKQAA